MRKIEIRTITGFFQSSNLEDSKQLQVHSQSILKLANLSPRTIRITTETITDEHQLNSIIEFHQNYPYFWGHCVPLLLNEDYEQSINLARKILISSDKAFVNFLAVDDDNLNTNAIHEVSKFIKDIAKEAGGIVNFRTGISARTPEGIPFFPFSQAKGLNNKFSVGLELTGFLCDFAKQNHRRSLGDFRNLLIQEVTSQLLEIEKVCFEISMAAKAEYLGMDLSIAPYPYPLEEQSVVELIENIGDIGRSRGEKPFQFGMDGTLFIHSYLANIVKTIVKNNAVKTIGFNGVMYSLLEDNKLSERYEDVGFNLDTLKLLSTTCGCGIDMVPLPYDVSVDTIASMVLDICSISILLQKPLGLRVLPMPDLRAGDRTNFKHLFFSNTVIKKINYGTTILNLPDQKRDQYFRFN